MSRRTYAWMATLLAGALGIPALAAPPAGAVTVKLSISDATIREGDTGNRLVTLTATLDQPTTSTVTAVWATTDGTATAADLDYTAKSGRFTFLPGQIAKNITIAVRPDVAIEGGETFGVNVTSLAGATAGDLSSQIGISDDDIDVAPGLSVGDLTIVEGDETSRNAFVTVALDSPAVTTVSGKFSTVAGTATASSDFVPSALKPFTIGAGKTATKLKVVLTPDEFGEIDETLSIELSNPVGAAIVDGTAAVTIIDDDAPVDLDGDTFILDDCGPLDPAVHPGATDVPDLAFVDANCDGIDGTIANAIFVSPTGNDANAGTQAAPKATLTSGIAAAAAANQDVFIATGSYATHPDARGVVLINGVDLYGGYVDGTWSRTTAASTSITNAGRAITAENVTAKLQLLSLTGAPAPSTVPTLFDDTETATALFASESNLTLDAVDVIAANGTNGEAGRVFSRANSGTSGTAGGQAECFGNAEGAGGTPGTGGAGTGPLGLPTAGGLDGGAGGDGGGESIFENGDGRNGESGHTFAGVIGAAGGAGGAGANPGLPGAAGADAPNASDGSNGTGAGSTPSLRATATGWTDGAGVSGTDGANARGGGGGGGGGARRATFGANSPGHGGGGGGGGGAGGDGGDGGENGGASIGIYAVDSTIALTGSSTVTAGNGGRGGNGGSGQLGGFGGNGGGGGSDPFCAAGAGGSGGDGGDGGDGGNGGGGAGGASYAIIDFGTSTIALGDATLTHGSGGVAGSGAGAAAQPGTTGTVLSL